MTESRIACWPGRLALLACLALAACLSLPQKDAEAPPAEPAAEPSQEAAPEELPPPKIATPAEQQQAQRVALKVADLLEAGRIEEARVEIERALEIDPANALAESFLQQLTVDPLEVLGSESFAYTVKPGESLSKIAGRFMGDIFQFYILARYNGIEVPRRVPAGQVIRIPGERPATPERPVSKPMQADHRPAEPERAGVEAVEREPAPVEGGVGRASDERLPTAEEAAAPESAMPAEAPVESAEPTIATHSGPPVEAEVVTVPAIDQSPAVVDVAAPPGPRPLPEPTPSDLAFQRGLREQAQGNNLAAFEAFESAFSLDPSNREARSNADLMHKEIVAEYTRRARAAFARQDLQGSIDAWNELLAFDPDNDIAQLERQKARVLQERIKSIR
ncbi:MAG: LysM peptidoglycan-binding domain-containing protein [Rhodocyclaceae bacterium]|nr:LysM peptidoglycan-binding domain-containing protein [Rhodocyclaceae bacterium]